MDGLTRFECLILYHWIDWYEVRNWTPKSRETISLALWTTYCHSIHCKPVYNRIHPITLHTMHCKHSTQKQMSKKEQLINSTASKLVNCIYAYTGAQEKQLCFFYQWICTVHRACCLWSWFKHEQQRHSQLFNKYLCPSLMLYPPFIPFITLKQ
jgi:hypothetical protein